jgi:toxin ParE1/3/4
VIVNWSPKAQEDLISIWVWRGRDNPKSGDIVWQAIMRGCARLRQFPELGPSAVELAENARKLIVSDYLALYSIELDHILIRRIVDQRRMIHPSLLSER